MTDGRRSLWRAFMLDAVFLGMGFGFLAVAVLYTLACDRL